MKQIIFDVETKLTFDAVGGHYPEKLGISFLGAIERDGLPETGVIKEVRHEIFEKDIASFMSKLEEADVVIGYNSDGFDLPTLIPYYTGDIKKIPSLDLLDRIRKSLGHRLSLDAVASQTLGTKKIGHGLDAITYYQTKQWDKLAAYCMKDVEITMQLYDYGRQHGSIKFLNKWNNPMEEEVDFSFTVEKPAAVQMSFF